MTNAEPVNPLAERIVDLYERHAREWDADRGRSLFEKPWLDRFAALLPPGASILDLGCGSAEPIGRYLIERGFHLTGIDSSPTLIALCRARFPDHAWTVADMRTLALGQTFHGLIAWDSFFHLAHADQRRMFPIFRNHSAPERPCCSPADHRMARPSAAIAASRSITPAWPRTSTGRCCARMASSSSTMSRKTRTAADTRSGSLS